MAWLVVSDDNESGPAIRADARIMAAHWQYELANRDIILAAGSLRDDDGVTKTGSLLVLDVATRAEAEAFFANDPATKAGMRGTTSIRYFNAAILNPYAPACRVRGAAARPRGGPTAGSGSRSRSRSATFRANGWAR